MLIIDTRSSAEFASGHIESAINLPPEQFMGDTLPPQLAGVAKDEPIVVYCRSGARSNVVLHMLGQHGFTNLTNGINQDYVRKLLGSK